MSERNTVYKAIKDLIVNLKLKPGEQLIESRLAEYFNISKTPIREALIKLYEDGFVEREPFRGAYVAKLRKKDIIDTFELRECLESVAVRDAAKYLSVEEIEEMKILIDKSKEAYINKDFDNFLQYDNEFQQILTSKIRNKRIKAILDNLGDHLIRISSITIRLNDLPELTFNDHQEIIEALTKRNAKQTEKITRQHINRVRDHLISQKTLDLITWFDKE